MLDWVDLVDFRTTAVIGVLPEEHDSPQPLDIEVRVSLDFEEAAETGDLTKTVDYAQIADDVLFLARTGRFWLLESLAIAISRHILAPPTPSEGRKQIEEVQVKLRKPVILGARAVPGIRFLRRRDWLELETHELVPGVYADKLVSTVRASVHRIRLEPGADWKAPTGVEVHVVAGSVTVTPERGGWGERHLTNGGTQTAVVLAVSHPPMTP